MIDPRFKEIGRYDHHVPFNDPFPLIEVKGALAEAAVGPLWANGGLVPEWGWGRRSCFSTNGLSKTTPPSEQENGR